MGVSVPMWPRASSITRPMPYLILVRDILLQGRKGHGLLVNIVHAERFDSVFS